MQIGYIDQQMAMYTSNKTVLDDFWDEYPNLTETEARNALGAFLFSGEDVFKNVNMLSGGEKVRLALCKILKTRPNVLVLDEPTNHMDIVGKETLESMLKDYKGSITVKIAAIAASAASVVAMAGDTVQMSPVAMLMIHDPSTVAMGNTKDMEKAIEVLTEVKESIINAYAAKSGLSHARIANLMSNETWMNAKKAVELGFADEILFAKKEEEPDSDPADPENP